jgi:hypothetical protein
MKITEDMSEEKQQIIMMGEKLKLIVSVASFLIAVVMFISWL